jgi:hypothetical protein
MTECKFMADIQGAVTGSRYFSRKLSRSRNDQYSADPSGCHHCRKSFAAGQMRYPVMTAVNFGGGWALASICMPCFKCASSDETSRQKRYERECSGCGEPMLTPVYGRFSRQVCSIRCYQRARRKHRRHLIKCEACNHLFKPSRNDARFCSNKCRQWQYRRRAGATCGAVGRG